MSNNISKIEEKEETSNFSSKHNQKPTDDLILEVVEDRSNSILAARPIRHITAPL
ncbi:hypothetical protein IIQ44_19030 [Acinetobacter oleivorans]|uniref:hypothetical protein n=1 Tax=Acinetobacter oleivorans TaxID=1148157 RepID=UPI00178C9D0F|nr:hypothetical protein [Acinetobacter oleivorans]MBE2173988.1 hypothetical protein [Acinetobacter oleivorans]MDY7372657.1 hypothetical protein [Acinetobacter oleivorans]